MCTAILDLCYLNYLLWFDVLDPKESLPVLLFHGERLCVTEKHIALKLTKSTMLLLDHTEGVG